MKELFVTSKITIRQAMKVLDKTAEKCLIVVDKDNKLKGTLTDGDIRRSILKGCQFSEDISNSYQDEPFALIKDKFDKKDLRALLLDKNLDLIPVVDKQNFVVDYFTNSSLFKKNKLNSVFSKIPVVIMAGGKGTRMEPFTKVLPKPLVPVHEKPIIEHIIESFLDAGCNDFYLSVNYKSKILKAYFEEVGPAYKINFIDEKEPLGTAGSLGLLENKFDYPFFVTNCDIIVKADYSSLYEFHKKGNYDVTLVASAKEYVIPYGTCDLNSDGHLSHINEKPKYDFLINTGLYVLNPDILSLIPKDSFYHITHLIQDAKDRGKKVGVFPIDDDSWVDVGQWTEYQHAVDRL